MRGEDTRACTERRVERAKGERRTGDKLWRSKREREREGERERQMGVGGKARRDGVGELAS